MPQKQNMVIGLEEDLTSLEFYNRSLFTTSMKPCYAKFLSVTKYEIVDYKIQINAGRTDRQRNHDQDTSRRTLAAFYLLRRIKATDISVSRLMKLEKHHSISDTHQERLCNAGAKTFTIQ